MMTHKRYNKYDEGDDDIMPLAARCTSGYLTWTTAVMCSGPIALMMENTHGDDDGESKTSSQSLNYVVKCKIALPSSLEKLVERCEERERNEE